MELKQDGAHGTVERTSLSGREDQNGSEQNRDRQAAIHGAYSALADVHLA